MAQASKYGNVVPVLWAWLIGYGIFFGSWDPGSAFHKLFVWPVIVLLIAVYVSRRWHSGRRHGFFIALPIAIAAWNFAAYIYPHSHESADPILSLALKIDRELPKTATVYYAALSPDDWYLEYFAPGRKWSHIDTGWGVLKASGLACFETTALQAFAQEPAFTSHIDPSRRWDLVNPQHNVRLDCLKQPSQP